MKDAKDTATPDLFALSTPARRPVGRPARYDSDMERKAARAQAARERRAREREAGWVEVRRRVKRKAAPLESEIIDLSAIPVHRRR
ncbi:MAG: hypothetical protein AB7T07_15240 [Steroidobacteraceae bacterium]